MAPVKNLTGKELKLSLIEIFEGRAGALARRRPKVDRRRLSKRKSKPSRAANHGRMRYQGPTLRMGGCNGAEYLPVDQFFI